MQRYFRYHIFLFQVRQEFSRLAILFRAILYYNKSNKRKIQEALGKWLCLLSPTLK